MEITSMKDLVMNESIIVCAFPGTGKSFITENNPYKNFDIVDSDSSNFSWTHVAGKKIRHPSFPMNYINYIEDLIISGIPKIIFISTHEAVINELMKRGHRFIIAYPMASLKDDYMDRYIRRGSPAGLVNVLNKNWDEWIENFGDMNKTGEFGFVKYVLGRGETLGSVGGLIETIYKNLKTTDMEDNMNNTTQEYTLENLKEAFLEIESRKLVPTEDYLSNVIESKNIVQILKSELTGNDKERIAALYDLKINVYDSVIAMIEAEIGSRNNRVDRLTD